MNRLTAWRGEHAFMTKDCEEAIDKLARLEDAEEQGRLIVLPCKLGDKVFIVCRDRVEELEIVNITDNVFYTQDAETMTRCTDLFPNDFGRFVFLTREDAEKALN